MRKTYILATVIIALLFLAACDDFTGPERWTEGPYIAITGNLHEGEPITLDKPIFIGRTVSASGGDLDDMFIFDAEVYIRDLTPGVDNSADSLEFAVDIENFKIGFIDPDQSLIPQTHHRYRLVARIPGVADSIWAETIVPDPVSFVPDSAFTLDPEPAVWPELYWEDANIDHPLKIEAVDDSVCYMYFRFYCLEEYEDHPKYTMTFMTDDEHPTDPDDYENPGSGWPRKTDWTYRYQPQYDPTDGGYYILDRGYKANIWFYGRYELTAYNIDENYYKYLYKPEGYRHGGINNGVGWFGSVSGDKIYTKVVEDE